MALAGLVLFVTAVSAAEAPREASGDTLAVVLATWRAEALGRAASGTAGWVNGCDGTIRLDLSADSRPGAEDLSAPGDPWQALLSRAGHEAENLEDFKGLSQRSPWFALMMGILMFSMAGVPFFIGFFAKFSVLLAVIATGQVWLAVVAVLFSLIGAFYYLRVVKLMYFDAPNDVAPIKAGLDMRLLLSANGLAVALFGLFPQLLMGLCNFALRHSL